MMVYCPNIQSQPRSQLAARQPCSFGMSEPKKIAKEVKYYKYFE